LNDVGQTEVPAGLSNVVAVAAGASHTAALRADGSVMVWGDDSFGQAAVPTNLARVVAIAAGGQHTLALQDNGRVVAWGQNTRGQCNISPNLADVVAIATGVHDSVAVRGQGFIATAGFPGNGATDVPEGLRDVIAVAGGGGHAVALANNISPQTRASALKGGSNRERLFALSLTHAGSDALTVLAGKFSHRLALYPAQKPPQPIPQHLTSLANEDMTITLGAVSSGTSAPAFHIASLPPNAKLYQYSGGASAAASRGPEITSGSVVTDAFSRVIFAPAVNGFGSPFTSFNFIASEVGVASSPATIALNVLPPAPPRIVTIEPLPNGAIQLRIEGHSSTTWRVSASTDLFTWEHLGVPTQLSPGMFGFTDTAAPQFPNRFYRVSLVPPP
jgi:hypothetical protein